MSLQTVIHKHLPRYREISRVLIEEGFEPLLDVLGLAGFVPVVRRVAPRLAAEPRESVEQRARHVLERLGPAFVKFGQILSTRPDLVPESFSREFRKLQDQVPAVPFDEVRQVVEHELGGELLEIFAAFDEVPLAAASIGQVHAATLHNGDRVVVKVQRPGIASEMDVDLDILLTQARFLEEHTSFGKRYEVLATAEEIARILREEMDYLHEARNAERFRHDFIRDERVVFPGIFWDYTTKRVITMQRLDGISLNRKDEIVAAGYDMKEIARRGISIYLEQVFVKGFFHADPHPGNIFVLPDGRIGFSDFGRAGHITEYARDRFGDLFLAVIEQDAREAVDVMLEVGVASADVDESRLRAEVSRLIAKYYDATLGQIRLRELIEELMRLVANHNLRIPTEFTLLMSTLAVLEGVGLELDPNFNFVDTARPFASDVMRLRFKPRDLQLSVVRMMRRLNKLFVEIPELSTRLLRKAAEGAFRVEFAPTAFDQLMIPLRELVNRLAFSILVGSFVIAFSFILRGVGLPRWMIVLSELGLLAAGIVGAWMFVSIFLSTFGKGRPM